MVGGLDWFELAKTSSMFLENNVSNGYYSDPYIRGITHKEVLMEFCDILCKLHEGM